MTNMSAKTSIVKKARTSDNSLDKPEIALAAVVSYKKQKEVGDFISFLLTALDRNSIWLNTVVERQSNFKCALLVGSGPNRFQLQEIIYPCGENEIKLEVEMKDSEDHDKIAIAALLRLSNVGIDNLLKFIKTKLADNTMLREDMVKGKALGINFVVLRPISDKQYRVMDRIVIGSANITKTPFSDNKILIKKRRRDEKLLSGPPIKKTRNVV